MDHYDPWEDDSGRRWRWPAGLALALLLGIVGWKLTSDDGTTDVRATPVASVTSTSVASEVGDDATESNGPSATPDPSDAVLAGSPDDDRSGTNVTRPTAPAPASTVGLPADSASTHTTAPDVASMPPITSMVTSVVTTVRPTTSAATTSTPATTTAPLAYPMSPDGTPLPILAVFDTETITISGQVPSQAAKDRLAQLAVANSQFPDARVVDNMLINPAVPISIGVRVIELNSARFPEGTDDILPEHAAELDRVVSIMNALPHISVLVVGHADQRGDDVRNFRISDARARAVVNYLLFFGIQPSRLASRAAGETDLLTFADDPEALALNRRTEFIFYGLLVE
jgi:outer membrane protein OmpA-like peptidoglycan-associated protein